MVTDALFKEPSYLYMDLVDSGTVNKWKPIYFDLNPSLPYDPDHASGSSTIVDYYPAGSVVDLSYFGAGPKKHPDNSIYYTINITRYLQRLVTDQKPNYSMRLYAPYNIIYPQYTPAVIPYVNRIAAGRIRLGGGNNADVARRMRLRVIYSKIN